MRHLRTVTVSDLIKNREALLEDDDDDDEYIYDDEEDDTEEEEDDDEDDSNEDEDDIDPDELKLLLQDLAHRYRVSSPMQRTK